MRVRVKAKEWSYNSKHTNVRKRIKRLAHKQERRELNTLTYSYELANDKFNEVLEIQKLIVIQILMIGG